MNFHLQEPNHELTDGYLILFIKISVVISFSWMIGVLMIYTYPCLVWSGNKYPSTLILFDKYHILSWICSTLAIFFYLKRVSKKYNNNLVTNFNFDQEKHQLKLTLLNIYTAKTKTEIFDFDKIKIDYEEISDKLYGKQRVFNLSNNKIRITTLNVDRCAWRKHTEIDSLIQKLKEFK